MNQVVEYYSAASNKEKYEYSLGKLHYFLNCPSIKIFLGQEPLLFNSSPLKQHLKIDENIDGFEVNSQKNEIFIIEKDKSLNKKPEEEAKNQLENKLRLNTDISENNNLKKLQIEEEEEL